jgi:hypothetical protein
MKKIKCEICGYYKREAINLFGGQLYLICPVCDRMVIIERFKKQGLSTKLIARQEQLLEKDKLENSNEENI